MKKIITNSLIDEHESYDALDKRNLNNAWINTYTGKKFYPLDPRPEDINIEDIAHALSQLCRFTGHSSSFYSVAEHSVHVSRNCEQNHIDPLMGLLHDASESCLNDCSSPLKRTRGFEYYRKIEHNLQSMIYKKFCGITEEPKSVKIADLRMLATEARDLMPKLHQDWKLEFEPYDFKIKPLPPKEAEQLFLNRFRELTSMSENKNNTDIQVTLPISIINNKNIKCHYHEDGSGSVNILSNNGQEIFLMDEGGIKDQIKYMRTILAEGKRNLKAFETGLNTLIKIRDKNKL